MHVANRIKTLKHIRLFILIFPILISNCSCGIGQNSPATGSSGATATAIQAPIVSDIFLDSLKLNIFVNTGGISTAGEASNIEVHIIDPENDQMIACIGGHQKNTLHAMQAHVWYSQLNTAMIQEDNYTLETTKELIVRLVNMRSETLLGASWLGNTRNCPSISSNNLLVDETKITYEDLFNKTIEIGTSATISFKKQADEPLIVEPNLNEPGGFIRLDQITITATSPNPANEESFGYSSLLFIDDDTDSTLSCIDLLVLQGIDLTISDIGYALEDLSDRGYTKSQLNTDTLYRIEIVDERSQGSCNALPENYHIIATTESFLLDEMIDQELPFIGDLGSVYFIEQF